MCDYDLEEPRDDLRSRALSVKGQQCIINTDESELAEIRTPRFCETEWRAQGG